MNSNNISNLATGLFNYSGSAAGTSNNVVGTPNQPRGFRTSKGLGQVEVVSAYDTKEDY